MSARPLQASTPEPTPTGRNRTWSYRLAWTYLPAMLVLSFAVVVMFGATWWTALVVVLLLACPAAIAIAIYLGFRPFPIVSRLNRDAETLRSQGKHPR